MLRGHFSACGVIRLSLRNEVVLFNTISKKLDIILLLRKILHFLLVKRASLRTSGVTEEAQMCEPKARSCRLALLAANITLP